MVAGLIVVGAMSHHWSVGVGLSDFPKHGYRKVLSGLDLTNLAFADNSSDAAVSIEEVFAGDCLLEVDELASDLGVNECHLVISEVLDQAVGGLGVEPHLNPRVGVDHRW